MKLAILLPTFGRPRNVARAYEDAAAASPGADVYFVPERDDVATLAAIRDVGAPCVINSRTRSYAGAVNSAVLALVDHDAFFVGNDDLHFRPGWLDAALPLLERHAVVGVNDLLNEAVMRGEHATLFLVTREYALRGCADEPGVPLHEGYGHNWVDTEFVATARARGEFAPCLEAVVEHWHWINGKAERDATYAKGQATNDADAALFRARSYLWGATP